MSRGRRLHSLGVTVWVLVVAAVTIPPPLGGISSFLDASWQVGLDLSTRLHLPMGSRLLFPYGPYGFLNVQTDFFTRQWYEALAATLAVHVALLVAVAALLLYRRAGPLVWLVTTAALVLGLPSFSGIDTEGIILAVVLAYLALDVPSRRWSCVAAVLCAAMLALLFLVKLTGFPLVAGVLVITTVACLWLRRPPVAAALLGTFVVVSTVLWVSAGLGIHDVATYLHATIDFGSGYSDAMYVGGLTPGIVVAGVVIVLVGLLGLGLLLRRRGGVAAWLLLVAVALFPIFKDSFVRDGPVRDAAYYGVAAMLAALSLAVVAPSLRTWRTRANLPAVALLVAVFILGVSWRSTDVTDLAAVGTRLADYGTVVQTVTDHTARQALQARNAAAAQKFYRGITSGLPQFFPGATVDVIPWDIALVYADTALTWDPRPVLQTYQAYTPWLDQLDADFLRSSSRAPDFIIYGYLTADDRYAAFDEPAMFRALLENYRIVRVLGPPAVVMRRVNAPPPPETTISSGCAPMGTAMAVPQRPGLRVYARVTVTPTLGGRFLDLLAKVAAVHVTLTTDAGSTDRRLVPATATDGLYVSSYLGTTPDLEAAITGRGGLPITHLTVHTDTWAWSSQYCVTFSSTPAG